MRAVLSVPRVIIAGEWICCIWLLMPAGSSGYTTPRRHLSNFPLPLPPRANDEEKIFVTHNTLFSQPCNPFPFSPFFSRGGRGEGKENVGREKRCDPYSKSDSNFFPPPCFVRREDSKFLGRSSTIRINWKRVDDISRGWKWIPERKREREREGFYIKSSFGRRDKSELLFRMRKRRRRRRRKKKKKRRRGEEKKSCWLRVIKINDRVIAKRVCAPSLTFSNPVKPWSDKSRNTCSVGTPLTIRVTHSIKFLCRIGERFNLKRLRLLLPLPNFSLPHRLPYLISNSFHRSSTVQRLKRKKSS